LLRDLLDGEFGVRVSENCDTATAAAASDFGTVQTVGRSDLPHEVN
jgi:hypothetical protein